MKEKTQAKVSIVIPCFNEEETLPNTFFQLTSFIYDNSSYDFDLVFVNDGSSDRTWQILNEFSGSGLAVKTIRLSRNFGHQLAVFAGLKYAKGDSVVVIDADLQHPLSIVLDMLNKRELGYGVVYGVRRKRRGETLFKKASAHCYYRVLNKLSSTDSPKDVGDFRVMSQMVVKCINEMPEHDRFLRGMISWVGFSQTSVLYDRNSRENGTKKYSFSKMIKLSLDGLVSFSTLPLKWSMFLGFAVSFFALLGVFYVLLNRLMTSNWVDGWTTLMLAVLFLGGVQLITMGILGEYVGRIYSQTKGRPLYLVSEIID